MSAPATLLLLGLAPLLISAQHDCDPERMRRCSFVVQEELQRRNVGHMEVPYHCRALRQGVDCMVRQVTLCPSTGDRSRQGDSIWKAWKYLQNFCDSSGGGWWLKRCYQREEIRHCERLYPLDVKSVARPSCETYSGLRDCVTDVVYRSCEPEDRFVLGTYLMDKGQELVWNCPVATGSGAYDRLRGAGPMVAEPGAAPPLSPTSLGRAGCNSRAHREFQTCYDRYVRDRREAGDYTGSEDRVKRLCCASHSYRRCAEDANTRYCTRPQSAEELFGPTSHSEDATCRSYWMYTCSGTLATAGWVLVATATMVLALL